ncbi:MAG: hypothetical protein KAS72_05905 [Phycisphaerales bacterium]|nr:hypothetical protein [Phycisphaerales bacterium]
MTDPLTLQIMDYLAQTLVPDLAKPPALVHYTLENPVPVGVGLLALAVILLFAANRLGRLRKGLPIVGGVLAISVLIFVLAAVIETGRERVTDRTRALIDLIALGDDAKVGLILSEDVSFHIGRYPRMHRKKLILRLIRHVRARDLIASHSVRDVRAEQSSPTRATTQVLVHAVTTYSGIPTPTWWQIQWQREPDGAWRVTEMHWLTLAGKTPDVEVLP